MGICTYPTIQAIPIGTSIVYADGHCFVYTDWHSSIVQKAGRIYCLCGNNYLIVGKKAVINRGDSGYP